MTRIMASGCIIPIMYTFFLILTLVSGAALGIGLVLVLAGRRRDESEGRAPRDLAPDQVTPDERSSAALRGTTPTTQLAADIGYAADEAGRTRTPLA